MSKLLRPRIKICGITQAQHVTQLAKLGVDAIGLVFYEKSPRHVSLSSAQTLVKGLPPFLTLVGLFVNHSVDFINQCLQLLPLHILQFHGNESPKFCKQFNRHYIKAIRVNNNQAILQAFDDYSDAQGILLDASIRHAFGGTGQCFDWDLVPNLTRRSMPIILSGGLRLDNVCEAIKQVMPEAVDVSSGVESGGKKDMALIKSFVNRVNNCHESN